MEQHNLKLKLLDSLFCICRLEPYEMIPEWTSAGTFLSITKTEEELSLVCCQNTVPENAGSQMVCEKGWKCLKVEGPLD